MEMCYDGALVMPSSYAVMSDDEMMYVEGGGKHFYNSVGFVSGAIDGLLYLVPTIAAVSKGLKFGKGLRTAVAAVGWTKKSLISGLVKIAQKVSTRITKSMVEKAVGFVWTACGLSIGGLIASGLDRADGKRDNYIFA